MQDKVADVIQESDIQTIISNFNVQISEYEIINMEKYQGWSSKYLYLLVSADENYILKAKTEEQINGYDNEVKVCDALLNSGISTRKPILTLSESIFHEHSGLHWCLMTYIPGAPSHINEYTAATVKSLAKHIDQYITAYNTTKLFSPLHIKEIASVNLFEILDTFMNQKDSLTKCGVSSWPTTQDLYECVKDGYIKFIKHSKLKSIIHNDINPRNILIDHKSRNVIALIDWDHVCIGNPLKDVSDAIAIVYDFLPIETATEYRQHFYKSINSSWFTELSQTTLDSAFLFYYTTAKWQTILFYLDLLHKYDNKYGERERFTSEILHTYNKWLDVVVAISL